jgi:hypothetical protein
MGIDHGAGVVEQTWSVLDFVEDDGQAQAFEERARVAEDSILGVGVFEQDVLRFGNGLAQKRGLASAAGSGDDQGGELTEGLMNHCREFSDHRHID